MKLRALQASLIGLVVSGLALFTLVATGTGQEPRPRSARLPRPTPNGANS